MTAKEILLSGGGAAYQIEGGQVNIGGTLYELKSGAVVIGGAEYEIPFVKKCTVTITGDGTASGNVYASVTIAGTSYSTEGSVEVNSETQIVCEVKRRLLGSARIYLNDTLVAESSSGYDTVSYNYTVTGNVTINLANTPRIDITEE